MPKGIYKRTKESWQKGKTKKDYPKMSNSGVKKGNKAWNKGKPNTWSNGEKSNLWKGGISTYARKLFLNLRRRSLKLNAEGSHTEGEWELLKKQYGYKCPCCNLLEPDISLTQDHIIPLSKGGSDYIENIQPLCKSCNCSKHTKIISYKGGSN